MKSTTSKRVLTAAAVDGWPGQPAVSRALGLGRTQVRRLVSQGSLVAAKGSDGAWRFSPVELEAEVARRRVSGADAVPPKSDADGAVAARAFELFAAHGLDVRRAVVEIKLTPAAAEQLARDYARLGGEVVLSREGLATLRARLGAAADLHSEADVLDAATQRAVRAAAELTRQVAERDEVWKARVVALETALAGARAQAANTKPPTAAGSEAAVDAPPATSAEGSGERSSPART